MSGPKRIRLDVFNAVRQPVPGAVVEVTVRPANGPPVNFKASAAPVTYPLPDDVRDISIGAAAAQYVPEAGVLTPGEPPARWNLSNPAWAVSHTEDMANIEVYLGRVQFAPIVAMPDDMRVPVPFKPGAILAAHDGYRQPFLNVLKIDQSFRVFQNPVIGDRNASGDPWNRFKWTQQHIRLADRGNWLLLEYGDTSGRPDALRHLVGVWAPHTFTGTRPPVVVQITPNPYTPAYPPDTLPFSGIYPYGCIPRQNAQADGSGQFRLGDCIQPYAELPAARCLWRFKLLFQLYAARPDIFDGPHGPIVITPAPALAGPTGVLRDPFRHRDGVGRMVAEVIRFLWRWKLTLISGGGSVGLQFRPPSVTVSGDRNPTDTTGFPREAITTVVCHSAAVAPVMELAAHASEQGLPTTFPPSLFGGPTNFCERDWKNLWIIDGVGQPGSIGVPTARSPASAAWSRWLKTDGRRLTCVYTPAGLSDELAPAPELFRNPTRRVGAAGWIEEDAGDRATWLRTSFSYLRASDPAAAGPEGVLPLFGSPIESGKDLHDKIYEFGIGYAASKHAQ